MYEMKDYRAAIEADQRVIDNYPNAEAAAEEADGAAVLGSTGGLAVIWPRPSEGRERARRRGRRDFME